MSPYNPRIRYLTSETNTSTADTGLPPDQWRARDTPSLSATLIKKTKLTPTITKYRFRLTSSDPTLFNPSNPPLWKVGQYVALDFSDELYMGYSHMRDDDPTSLNDDFTRTFTIVKCLHNWIEAGINLSPNSDNSSRNLLSYGNIATPYGTPDSVLLVYGAECYGGGGRDSSSGKWMEHWLSRVV